MICELSSLAGLLRASQETKTRRVQEDRRVQLRMIEGIGHDENRDRTSDDPERSIRDIVAS